MRLVIGAKDELAFGQFAGQRNRRPHDIARRRRHHRRRIVLARDHRACVGPVCEAPFIQLSKAIEAAQADAPKPFDLATCLSMRRQVVGVTAT